MRFGVRIKNSPGLHHVKFGSSGSKGLALACFLLIFFWKSKFLKGVHVVFWEKNSLVMFSMQNCPCMQISMLCWKMAAPVWFSELETLTTLFMLESSMINRNRLLSRQKPLHYHGRLLYPLFSSSLPILQFAIKIEESNLPIGGKPVKKTPLVQRAMAKG